MGFGLHKKSCIETLVWIPHHAFMKWTEQPGGQALILKIQGEIDLQHSPTLRQLLQTKATERVAALVLDLSEVRYIDSSGLATLVEYYKNARVYSGQMAVAGPSPRVRGIFDLVRLTEIFGVYSTVAEAEQALLSKT